MSFTKAKTLLLTELATATAGDVYLKTTIIPDSYPSGTYQFKGFEPTSGTDRSSSKGFYKFALFMVEDVTDYAKSGDVWDSDGSAGTVEDTLKTKLDSLTKALMAKRVVFEGYEVYPGIGDGGRDLLIGRLDVKVRGTI